ncbi:phage holin family protein [Citrobacter arsenatis]|uniref:phage holin family protein n=1 Tax=Citrobacter arsenatis TaxID=2546350 RepID=UPI00300E40A8
MIEKEPSTLGWLNSVAAWALGHPYASWGSCSAFLVALWSSLKDGLGWIHSLFGAALAVLITLSVLAMMRKTGLHDEWMPLVGLVVGFVGADRIRAAVLGAWDSRKNNLVKKDESEK